MADLIAYLPPDAALWIAIDPDMAAWSSRLLLANLVATISDALREEPIPRPWDKASNESGVDWGLTGDVMSMDEAAAYFGF